MRAEASAIRVRRAAAATAGFSEAARCSSRWGGTIVQKGEVIPAMWHSVTPESLQATRIGEME
ncbi:hypothetical protein GCM10010363_10610 [Streptomyces omiyaensis]|nr:hypothetical protein GCM10010363_10610 [Streptomyces omiyaensis]